MVYAIIENNKVVNIIEADEEYANSVGAIPATNAGIGYEYRDGLFIAPPLPEPQIPQAVTMRQARLALFAAGLLSSIDSTIAALPSPQKEAATIEWEYSQEVQRYNSFVPVLAPLLGLTSNQIDNLFTLAATL